jgi:hypothetical protein
MKTQTDKTETAAQGQNVRKFQLTLTDNDGETHEYSVQARNPWEVLNFAYGKMSASGDFYGHTLDMSQDISVSELVADAKGSFIIL